MKKIFLLILFATTMQTLFAQSVKFGIKGGLNESDADFGPSSSSSTTSNLSGFNAGVFTDIEFNKLSIEPGIFYTTNGYNTKTVIYQSNPAPNSFSATGRASYNYLEVPLNLLYNIRFGSGKIFVGAGPYYGLALSGTRKGSTTVNGTTTIMTDNINFGSAGDFRKTDVGINALAGITLKSGLLLSVNYGYALTNIYNAYNTTIKKQGP